MTYYDLIIKAELIVTNGTHDLTSAMRHMVIAIDLKKTKRKQKTIFIIQYLFKKIFKQFHFKIQLQ